MNPILRCLLAAVFAAPAPGAELTAGSYAAEALKDEPADQTDSQLPKPATVEIDFARDIKPIFQEACFKCHGPNQEKGGFSLATKARALEGGDEGSDILAGNSAASLLVQRIASQDEESAMPPEGKRLSAWQVGLIRAWIDQGAVWPTDADEIDPRRATPPSHWSFKSLQQPPIPERKDTWVSSPIDAFILTKLDEATLSPAPEASREALLRRASFDLIGLAPSPEEVAAFTSDASAEAFAKVVDRLLESPAYGERWARHWLDVVRYADSGGYETDIFYEQAWRYRDYVIRSFNEDKGYDRFLMEQVAGDELWPEQAAMEDAVAVWTLGEWPNALDAYPESLEYLRRSDQVSTLSEAVLGLTIGCANCHDHKYDPITQRDYFGMEAIFAASETYNKNTNTKAWGKGERTAYRALRHAEQPIDIHLLKRGELTKPTKLIAAALPTFLPGGGALPSGLDEAKQRRSRLARWIVSPQNPLTARVMANRLWQWHFGQALAATPNDLGTQGAPPSHPELLDWLASELIKNDWKLKKLHRRIMLSSTYRQSAIRTPEAIAQDPQNRLLAGFSRRRLAAEEVWDHLHAVAGTLDTKSFGAPFVPVLSPEELQGMYDLENKRELKWPVTSEQNRRAIYLLNRRSFRFPFFEAFDPPNTATSCAVRQTTTVPAQALTLLNNPIVSEQAGTMARRIAREAENQVEVFVQRVWLLAYSREATEGELDVARQFLVDAEIAHRMSDTEDPRAAALVDFCLGVMNTTEFIYTH
jgi:mono/diheme cytochrome c family protein